LVGPVWLLRKATWGKRTGLAASTVSFPLPPALSSDGFALRDAPLFALGHEKAFSLDSAQHAITGYFFAKALEQAFLRLSSSEYYFGHA